MIRRDVGAKRQEHRKENIMESIETIVMKRRLQWIGHVNRKKVKTDVMA